MARGNIYPSERLTYKRLTLLGIRCSRKPRSDLDITNLTTERTDRLARPDFPTSQHPQRYHRSICCLFSQVERCFPSGRAIRRPLYGIMSLMKCHLATLADEFFIYQDAQVEKRDAEREFCL